jgi:hypothetical protein
MVVLEGELPMSAMMTAERLPVPAMNFVDIEKVSKAISPQLFQLKSAGEVLTLMLLGQADGIHPITALRRYHIIEGKPVMKADAMMACFKEAGGKVKWLKRDDAEVSAVFINGDEEVTVNWDAARATKAGLIGKSTWTKYPRQMLTARVISEGIRIVMPQIVSGIYTPEEVTEFDRGPNQQTWGDEPQPTTKQVEAIDTTATVVETPKVPEATKMSQEDIATKSKDLWDWTMAMLNPEHFKRTPETTNFALYKDQIVKDGAGLPDAELRKLRANAYCQYLLCMVCTSPEGELDSWKDKIAGSKLDEAQISFLNTAWMQTKAALKGVTA